MKKLLICLSLVLAVGLLFAACTNTEQPSDDQGNTGLSGEPADI